ncbi:MAG: GGDEF domain-containing protein [Marinomonas sp.]
MGDLIDIRTLLLNSGFLSLFFALGLFLFARFHPTFKGIKLIGCALFINFFSLSLNGAQQYVPDLISIILANCSIYLSFYLVLLGFSRYLSVPIPKSSWLSLVGFVFMLIGMMHFTFNQYDVNARIMIMSSASAIQLVLISLLLLKGNDEFGKASMRVLSSICLLSAAYFSLRVFIVSQSVQLDFFMNAGLLHSMVLIVYQVLVVSFSFSIVWMTTTNLELKLRLQASLDPLTQVYNRRALDEIVADRDVSSKLNQVPLSAIMLDIDYFKKLNDGHGHKAGDTVLQKLAMILTKNTRENDSVARYGGEEFIILLPNTSREQAERMAENLRVQLSDEHFSLDNGSDEALHISASFGVATRESEVENWENVFKRVDVALYKAKRTGRNKVESA